MYTCDKLEPEYFDSDENPVGICCSLLSKAEAEIILLEIELGIRQLPKTDSPKPIPVR